jgi:predicted MFS family arabinose efflux permease
VVLLALPAGAAADVFDRRRLLLATQTSMLVAAAALCAATVLGLASPTVVLALTFLLGLGNAANAPAWQATIPELVGGRLLAPAVALNSAGFNIGRAVGPALGGLVVAAAGPAAVFGLNAVSFLGVLAVLWRWRRRPQDELGAGEQVLGAIGAGVRYVRFAPPLRAVLVRTALFILPASALWALLPVVARGRLQMGATGFGLLLGALGIGSVAGAVLLPRLRRAIPIDRRVMAATGLFALATVALAVLDSALLLWLAMVAAGVAWLATLTSFNVATQTAVPRWVRARALAVYLLVFQGGLAGGSALWGVVAGRLGERTALLAAAASFALGMLAALRWRLQAIGGLDLTPSVRPEPVTVMDPEPDDGPVLVLVRYRVDPSRTEEFGHAPGPPPRRRLPLGPVRGRGRPELLRRNLRGPLLGRAPAPARALHRRGPGGPRPGPVLPHRRRPACRVPLHPPRRRHDPAPLGPLDPPPPGRPGPGRRRLGAAHHLGGDVVQAAAGGAGLGAQQVERRLLVQPTPLHDHALGLLDQAAVVERALELAGRLAADVRPDGGAQQRGDHPGVGLDGGHVGVVPAVRPGGVDVERADRALGQVDGDAQDGADPVPGGQRADRRPARVGVQVGGQDGRVVQEGVDARPLAELLLEGLEHAPGLVRGGRVAQHAALVQQQQPGAVDVEHVVGLGHGQLEGGVQPGVDRVDTFQAGHALGQGVRIDGHGSHPS